jgi:hypothetical protein
MQPCDTTVQSGKILPGTRLDCTLNNRKKSVEMFEYSCFAESEIGFNDVQLIDHQII